MRTLPAVLAFALLAAPARGAEVARLPLDSTITAIVAGRDGGAWLAIGRGERGAIGRADAGGGFRSVPVDRGLYRATLGPDGQAWFRAGSDLVVRADTSGRVTTVGRYGGEDVLGFSLATGGDGTVWVPTLAARKLARITPSGAVSFTPLTPPACKAPMILTELAAAPDGSMWIADTTCGRMLHLFADGRVTTLASDVFVPTTQLAADSAGGVWFATSGEQVIGHVDAAGQTTYADARNDGALGVAVASDGSAWFTVGRCELARVAADGTTTLHPAPLPAIKLAFGPGDVLWLASERRLVRTTVAELDARGCDGRSPRLKASPRPGRISLAQLRRGLVLRANERAVVQASVWFAPRRNTESYHAGTHAAPWRFRLNARRLRKVERSLAGGHRAEVSLLLDVRDFDGNGLSESLTWRITR